MSIFMRPNTVEYSIVDPIQSSLDEDVVYKDRVRPEILDQAKDVVERIAQKYDIDINKIWIIGSSLTYQWTPESDIDVTIFIEKMSPEELTELNKDIAAEFNEKHYVAQHPLNFHVVSGKYYKFKSDAIYDVETDKWVKKPEALSEDDVEELIKGCSSLDEFTEILEEYTKLRNYLESYRGKKEELHES